MANGRRFLPTAEDAYNFVVRTVSIHDALVQALAVQVKRAEISTNPRSFFVHVRVPDHVAEDLRATQRKVIPDTSKHVDIDHVTLVFTRKGAEDHPPDKVHAALTALRDIGARVEPIQARIQGWGYFDGASNEGKPSTALVALVDAPGLEHLHVDMARRLKDVGIEPSDLHVFTPHITLGYLGHHGRVEGELPPLPGRFTIDKVHVAARDHHEVPLTGQSLGQKAAAEALPLKELNRGLAEETKEHRLPLELTEKLVRDHLEKEPGYYKEEAKVGKLGMAAAAFAMSPSELRIQRRDAPGKGETSAVVGMATPQTGGMHSGGGLR